MDIENKSIMKFKVALCDLYGHVQDNPCISKAWVAGSLVEGTYDSYSDVNLYIKFAFELKNHDSVSLLNRLGIVIIEENLTTSKIHQMLGLYKDSVWFHIFIVQDETTRPYKCIDLKDRNVDIEDVLSKTSPYKLISHWKDQERIKEKLVRYFDGFLGAFKTIEAGLGRNDLFVIQLAIEKMRSCLLNASLIISKCGNIFDNNRIEIYLHEEIKKLFMNTYSQDFLEKDDSGSDSVKIGEAVKRLFEIFTILLSDYDVLYSAYPRHKVDAIQRFMKDRFGWNSYKEVGRTDLLLYDVEIASTYDKNRPVPQEMQIGFQKLGQLLMLNKKIMELGPGTGRVTMEVLPFAKEYVGIEYSLPMLNFLKSKIDKKGHMNTKLIHGDMMKLVELCPDEYDVIFENSAIQFALDPFRVVDQIFSMLKPDGLFIRINEFWQEDLLQTRLTNIFHHTVSKIINEPYITKNYADARKKMLLHMQRRGITTRKERLASFEKKMFLGDFVQTFKDRTFPRFHRFSDAVIEKGIDAVRQEVSKYGVCRDEDYFIDKIDLICFISEKAKKECEAGDSISIGD
ncbi:class I SAM-dependent methyltransferase [Paenibacillus pinisoli]|uniref:Class I SAM-dependent methyltransferase n=1 Tax=Paenibacillus pinisoli TaxID=1276110 RepID=A0A3A6PF95_9BACL|nr:class I SAM-dependent methyltransferase [Paenibacillus pinisoli]RJX37518.1 class I SAM-dependent methyltransferase [Paenibacillus pinisoli]